MGSHSVGFVRILPFRNTAIKWLAHQQEISNPERWGFRAPVLAEGQESNRHHTPSCHELGDVGCGGRYGWPFLVILKDSHLFSS